MISARQPDLSGPMSSVDAANQEALDRIRSCEPHLTGIRLAGEALGMAERQLGHAGPPFRDPSRIPPVVLSALAGAAVLEGWATNHEDGRRLILEGSIRLTPNHELGTASPMAGVVRPSQPVMEVRDAAGSETGFATFAEGGRQGLRFGVWGSSVVRHLSELELRIAPAIAAALPQEGLPVWPLVSQGLRQGDDIHQRNEAFTQAFIDALEGLPPDVAAWLGENPQHCLNYAMGAAKLALDTARSVSGSSIVVAVARNGDECGIQLAGTGDRWFCAPSNLPRGQLFGDFTPDDCQPDLGDSAIMETIGLGGGAAFSAPALNRKLGVAQDQADRDAVVQRSWFLTANPWFAPPDIPDARDYGLGLDAREVARSHAGLLIHTGIAHRDGATGWIGIGRVRAPVACFSRAVQTLQEITDAP